MANLVLGNPDLVLPKGHPLSNGRAIRQDIIEISSDEEIDETGRMFHDYKDNSLKVKTVNPKLASGRNTALGSSVRGDNPKTQQSPTPHSRHAKRQKTDHLKMSHYPVAQKEPPHELENEPLPAWAYLDIDFDAFNDLEDMLPLEPIDYAKALGLTPGTDHPLTGPAEQPITQPKNSGVKVSDTTTGMEEMAQEKSKPCPYYQDQRLGVLMYCGPGYEQFPIVFGSEANHQRVCDEWDSVEAAQAVVGKIGGGHNTLDTETYLCHEQMNGSANKQGKGKDKDFNRLPNRAETSCLSKVCEVLPDVEHNFVYETIRSLISEQSSQGNEYDIEEQPSADEVIMTILGHESYPKQKKQIYEKPLEDLGKTIPLLKGDAKDDLYRLQSVNMLAIHFDRVPTCELNTILTTKKSLYDAYIHIEQVEETYYSFNKKPYKRLQKPRAKLEKKYRTERKPTHTDVQWRNVINELQAAKQQVARSHKRAALEKQNEALEATNLEEHKRSGNIVECRCCFDDEIALNRAVACESPDLHWFCYSCVKNLAESQMGMMRYEMACMDGTGCKAALSPYGITQAVPTKVLDKLDFFQQHAEILAAGIEGLEQCQHCEFRGICDPVDHDPVFRCQNPDCGRHTCRLCHEDAHVPKTCDESRKDKGLSARHLVEEARSEAMMRACPGCKVKIVKAEGCNKITCTKCSHISCFVCKQDITDRENGGYQHFNKPGATCALYDKDFDRHKADADKAEEEAIAKIRAENSELDEKQLQIETSAKKSKDSQTNEAKAENRNVVPRLGVGPLPQHALDPLPPMLPLLNQFPGGGPHDHHDQQHPPAYHYPPNHFHAPPAKPAPLAHILPIDHMLGLATAQQRPASIEEQHARRQQFAERVEKPANPPEITGPQTHLPLLEGHLGTPVPYLARDRNNVPAGGQNQRFEAPQMNNLDGHLDFDMLNQRRLGVLNLLDQQNTRHRHEQAQPREQHTASVQSARNNNQAPAQQQVAKSGRSQERLRLDYGDIDEDEDSDEYEDAYEEW